MKKRLLSLLLTVCLVAALFTGLTGTANAADDKVVGYLTSYTLKAGDTIYGVCEAKKIDFNANLAMIGKINGITNYNYMMPGKVLWLPTKTATTSESYYSLLSHTLVAGETPAALCQSYGIDYNANYKLLAALNNNLNVFMAGQQFILPLYVTPAGAATPTPAPTSGTSAAPTATPKPGTTPAPTANVPTGDTVSYYLAQHTLQYGETVSGVCAALGVDFSSNDATIRKINNITNYNYMMPGKVILIPTKTVPGSGSYYKIMAHKIVSGDTLYALCASYGLDYYAYSKLISLLNPNAAYYNLLPGNILYMPQYVAASTTVKPAATPAPAASAGTTAAYDYNGPVYLRFSRLATPVFHDPATYQFQIGKGEKLTDGYDIAVIATGLMVPEALRAAVLAKRQGIAIRVINMPTIKPIDEDIILTAARECRRIITVEEHSIIGGLGEAVCSVVAEKLPVPVRRIGVMDQFGHSGPAAEVLRDYGLTAENIVSAVREMVRPDQPAAE